jgi:hypothetical protein
VEEGTEGCRVEIDEQVYTRLGGHAVGFETPDDVLRRLVLRVDLDSPVTNTQAAVARSGLSPSETRTTPLPGALEFLLTAGAVKPGDRPVHRQVRKGRSYAGTVDVDGCIRTDHGLYRAPSPALRDLVGT